MRPAPGEWDCLRLAAKAADRGQVAEALRPAFEERLGELGYSPLAIAHAFGTLTGPGTVEEALAELEENARLERIVPVPLDFELVEREPGLPVGHSLRCAHELVERLDIALAGPGTRITDHTLSFRFDKG